MIYDAIIADNDNKCRLEEMIQVSNKSQKDQI